MPRSPSGRGFLRNRDAATRTRMAKFIEWVKNPKEKSWSRTKRVAIWATLAATLAASGAGAYFRTHPREWRITQVNWGLRKFPPVTVTTKDGRPFTYKEAPEPSEMVGSGDQCLRYARLVCKDHGYKYNLAEAAWELESNNKHVWKITETTNPDSYEKYLKPFRLLGVYNPQSGNNREGRLFTHVLVYMGKVNGEHLVAHNLHGGFRLESLDFVLNDLLAKDGKVGEVREVFTPQNE